MIADGFIDVWILEEENNDPDNHVQVERSTGHMEWNMVKSNVFAKQEALKQAKGCVRGITNKVGKIYKKEPTTPPAMNDFHSCLGYIEMSRNKSSK